MPPPSYREAVADCKIHEEKAFVLPASERTSIAGNYLFEMIEVISWRWSAGRIADLWFIDNPSDNMTLWDNIGFWMVHTGVWGRGMHGRNMHVAIIAFSSLFSSSFLRVFFWSKNKRKSAKAFPAKWGEVPLKTSLPYTSIDWYYGPNVTIDHKDQISRPATATAATIVSLYKMFHSTFHWQTCVLSFSLQFWPDTKQPEL